MLAVPSGGAAGQRAEGVELSWLGERVGFLGFLEEGDWSATNILLEALQELCSPTEVSKAARRPVAGGSMRS